MVLTAASEDVCWDFGDKKTKADETKRVVKTQTSALPQTPELLQESEVHQERIYCNLVELTEDPVYENQRSQDAENEHLYENTVSEEPWYENYAVPVSDDDKEHIYEHVSCQSPVNVFLGLLQSDTETISPDPNIYEVPPGAIFNSNLVSFEEPDAGKVKPPKGFQDYENVCWDSQRGFDEDIFALPVEVLYSTVVKPKRRKCRPHISAMLYGDKDAALRGVEGRTIETSAATDMDSNSANAVNGCSVTGNMEKHAETAGCEASGEHVSGRTEVSDNDISSSGNVIDYKYDGSVVYLQDNSNDTKADDNGDSSHNVKFHSSLISSGENPIKDEVKNSVDPAVDETIKIHDVLNLCEDKTLNAKTDNNVSTRGSNIDSGHLDKCLTDCEDSSIDTKVDQCVNCSGDDEKLAEDRNCRNSYGNKSIDTKVDTSVTSCEDAANGVDVQDKTVACKDESIAICVASSEDNAIYANIDQCLSCSVDPKNHSENNAAIIISGDSSESGGTAEERMSLSNEISDSVNGELPKSTVISGNNTDNESESKMSETSQKDCTIIEDAECEETSVIEISEDGTWETKTVPPAELSQVKQEEQNHSVEEPEFLCAVDRSVKTIYGSQYYVNCPVASVKPMKQGSASAGGDGVPRNIGAQIMDKHDKKMQKLRETLPDVSLLDVDATLEDIERERRRIIENQAVRAKKISSWVRNGRHPDYMPEDLMEMENVSSVEGKTAELPSSAVPDIVVSVDRPDSVTKFNTSCVDVETCTDNDTPKGEVVYDSIIQNKHKTKSYWEQLMMAAAASEQPRTPFKRDLLSLGSDGEDGKPSSDVSEQEYYDARSQISLHSPAEPLDSLDQTYDLVGSGPKIVETVAKKLMEAEAVKLNKSVGEESVIEMDIRLQREREAALAREREEAFLMAAAVPSAQVIENSPPIITVSTAATSTPIASSTETKIALELREMREREEELRRLRQRLSKDEPDDGFNSIPNTDEGNFSEYGSEEKELSLDGNSSRMMSPEVLAGPGSFLHQRTQSMDSMSSGHSSGSGSGSGNTDVIVGRRRITVKPLDEPDDEEIPSYMLRNQKETPIEREIRLAREREEELRREKRLPPLNHQPSPAAGKQEVRWINSRNTVANDPRSVQHRLATSRIQQEIDEATEREKEMREAGMIQTVSEETVDSKVTRFTDLAEFAIEEQDRKLKKSVSTSHIPQSVDETDAQASISPISVQKIQNGNGSTRAQRTFRRSISQSPSTPALSPRKFPTTVGQKGLMQRFLANRGKMGTLSSGIFTASTSPTQTPVPVPPVTANKLADAPVVERQNLQESEERENGDVQRATLRRGYVSAEEKIQVELQEMQKREEELRLQRARSQPNLLCLGDEEEEESHTMNGNVENHVPLRSAVSNPHLLDIETTPQDTDSAFEKPSFKSIRKRSALIAQWENIIQQNIEH